MSEGGRGGQDSPFGPGPGVRTGDIAIGSVLMVRSRRGEPRHTDSSGTAQEHAVRGAEAIVCLAWAQELLDRHDATALARATARRA